MNRFILVLSLALSSKVFAGEPTKFFCSVVVERAADSKAEFVWNGLMLVPDEVGSQISVPIGDIGGYDNLSVSIERLKDSGGKQAFALGIDRELRAAQAAYSKIISLVDSLYLRKVGGDTGGSWVSFRDSFNAFVLRPPSALFLCVDRASVEADADVQGLINEMLSTVEARFSK